MKGVRRQRAARQSGARVGFLSARDTVEVGDGQAVAHLLLAASCDTDMRVVSAQVVETIGDGVGIVCCGFVVIPMRLFGNY